MSKAGGVIGIIAGIFGFIAAIATLFVGGLGSAFDAEGANTVVGLGWGGILFSFLAIVFGAVALARPKGAGIGLIAVSILGAILGGTLVAICMALSLIGGILAVIGAKSVKASPNTATETNELPGVPAKKKTSIWLLAGGGAFVLVIGLAVIGSQATNKSKEDPLAELANAQPSALRAEGELSDLFALGSKNTDLQRENKLNEIKGQVVQWQLPVYEVSRSGDGYKVQTKSGSRVGVFGQNMLGTFIHITPRNDAERQAIEALKTGDPIHVKGRIAGSSMRSLELKPAILVSQVSPQPQQEPLPQEQQTTQATSQTSAKITIGDPPESVLDNPALKDKFTLMLGDKYDQFRERLSVSSGITQEGEWVVGEGGMPHLFSIEESAFAINSSTGEMYAIMLTEGKEITWFGTKDFANLPPPLQAWYKAHGGQ